MKIYTKTGDDGTTSLQGGRRVRKSNLRITAYGIVDEINSNIGIILTGSISEGIKQILKNIQNELFVLGSDLSNPNLSEKTNRVKSHMVKNLEDLIDTFEKELEPLSNFILPGGTKTAAYLHLTRTIIRRAETEIVKLQEVEKINDQVLQYLNRLSDLFFVLARIENKRNKIRDTIWKPQKDTL